MTESENITILLVDDHLPFRVGMRVLLEQVREFTIIGEADSGKKALLLTKDLRPDVLILDCQMSDLDGPSVADQLEKEGISVQILALSAFSDTSYVRRMLAAGATGYLLKSEAVETIIAAVHATVAGQPYFSASIASQLAVIARKEDDSIIAKPPTPRETEVLQHLVNGLTNAQIAKQLGIRERTVRFHVENLFTRLNVESRTEAAVKAIRLGWVTTDE